MAIFNSYVKLPEGKPMVSSGFGDLPWLPPPVPGLARSPFPVAVPSVAPAAPWAAAPALPAPPAAPGATEHLVKSDIWGQWWEQNDLKIIYIIQNP